jgi:hypothetical protein
MRQFAKPVRAAEISGGGDFWTFRLARFSLGF